MLMSISTMTNAALARRDFAPRVVPQQGTGMTFAGVPTVPATTTGTVLAAITTYIPTEILTLYVAARSALQSSVQSVDAAGAVVIPPASARVAEWLAFIIGLLVTPLFVWIVYATKRRAAGRRLPLRPSQWPVWEMVAATVAFAAWAIALPNSPFTYFRLFSPAIGALFMLLASTALGVLAPLMTSTNPAKSGE
jgi:hypothetical protein